MSFPKKRLCADIALILSAGILLGSTPQSVEAQLPQFNCRPNSAGDGWICESLDGTPATVVPRPSTRPTSPEPEPAGAPASLPEAVAIDDNTLLDAEAATPAATVPTALSAIESVYELDYVPREAMTAEQLLLLPENCCGAFIDPAAGNRDPDADPANAGIQFQTDIGLQQISQNLISIDGDVIVQQGYRTIENDNSTSIDRQSNTILMEGNIVFREPGLLLTGDSAYIDSDDSVNRIETAQYVIHDYGAHGTADSIVYSSDSGLVSIENGEFSRCEPDNPFWRLEADTITLDQASNRGYARNVSLKVGNVPLFYYPFTMAFPLGDERISGFLAPSTGSTRSGGFDFELPYYFNLAPNYDATLSPRLISDRGIMTSAELRYLANWSMNTVNMSHLGGDDLFDPTTKDIRGSDSPPVADRWFIGYEHFGAIGQNITTFVDYNAVSDNDYFYDLGSNGLNLTSRTHLNRQGRVNFTAPWLRAGLNVQRIQIIDPLVAASDINKPFDRLPQFVFDTDTYLAGGFRIGLTGQVSSFDRKLEESLLSSDQLDNGALINGERINLEPAISWSIENPGWFVRANAKYKHVQYKLQNQASLTAEDPDLGIGVYSLDSGLIFERNQADGGSQTLEPRIFYLNSEYQDQSQLPLFDTSELNFSFSQLFRDDRFSGGDRIGDADQVTIALTSRFLDARGKEKARVSLGQIQYFEDRQVSLSNPLQNWQPRYSPLSDNSALAGELAFSLGENWRLNSDVQWEEESEEVIEGSFQLRYQRDRSHLFNLSYRYRRLINSPNFILPPSIDPRIKQTDLSGIWPLNENWKLLGRWNYDHSNSRNLESFAGIEWSNCCATIRLIGREWVDENELFLPNIEPNRGIFVQFTLNGLGNVTGGGLSNLLSDGIWGFRDSDYE